MGAPKLKADPQKLRIYAWEVDWHDWNIGSFNLKEMREAVGWACAKYGVKPPRVAQHADRQYSYSMGSPDNLISFRLDQRNAAMAMHEAAHFIHGAIFGEDTLLADHGPEFMGIYLWLLEGYRIAPRRALHASAATRRIRWVPTWTMSPKRLRRKR